MSFSISAMVLSDQVPSTSGRAATSNALMISGSSVSHSTTMETAGMPHQAAT